jgi:hypothetical protein
MAKRASVDGRSSALLVACAVAFSLSGGCSAPASDGWFMEGDAGSDGAIVPSASVEGGDDALRGAGGMTFVTIDSGKALGTGTCKEGKYSGTFTCYFDPDGGTQAPAADGGGFQVTGTLTLTLTRSPTGEFQDVASGKFTADTSSLISATADLSGNLDCNTGKFTGQLANGMYSGWIFINGTFQGPLASDYDGTNFAFVRGTWVMTIPNTGTCPGTWSAHYVGP